MNLTCYFKKKIAFLIICFAWILDVKKCNNILNSWKIGVKKEENQLNTPFKYNIFSFENLENSFLNLYVPSLKNKF